MTIDVHTHVFPEQLAARALRKLAEKCAESGVVPISDGTIASLLRETAAAGVDCAIVCPIATRPDAAFFEGLLREALAISNGERGEEAQRRIIPLGSVHPDDPERFKHLEELSRHGIRGVKLHPFYQPLVLDSREMLDYFRCCRDCNLVALVHCGYDIGFPWQPIAGPERIDRVITEVPGIKFVAAHLGGLFQWGGVLEHLVGKDVWLDTSIPAASFDDPNARRVLFEHRADRLLFATDWPWLTHADGRRFVASSGRPANELNQIFGANAAELFGIEV